MHFIELSTEYKTIKRKILNSQSNCLSLGDFNMIYCQYRLFYQSMYTLNTVVTPSWSNFAQLNYVRLLSVTLSISWIMVFYPVFLGKLTKSYVGWEKAVFARKEFSNCELTGHIKADWFWVGIFPQFF